MQQTFISLVLEAGESKMQVLADSAPGESPLPGLHCPQMAERALSLPLQVKLLIPPRGP